MDAITPVERFVAEFAEFENRELGFALQSLSNDQALVKRAEAVLNLEARLTLLKRVAYARRLDQRLAGRLDHISRRARRLCETRDDLIRAKRPTVEPSGMVADFNAGRPTFAELDEYRLELSEFASTLRLLVEDAESQRYVNR